MRLLAALLTFLFCLPLSAVGAEKECSIDYQFLKGMDRVFIQGKVDCDYPNGYNIILRDAYNGKVNSVLEYTDHPYHGFRDYIITLTQWRNSELVIRGNK
jgi:Iap family predicted aminopeptidase